MLSRQPEYAVAWHCFWLEGAHARRQTARVHHAARRRGGRVAARGAGAAAGKSRSIGYWILGPSARRVQVEALRRGLARTRLHRRREHASLSSAGRKVERLPEIAAELVGMNVNVIFAPSSTMVEPARQATNTIPIVFSNHADPVGSGHVASFPRPGGNVDFGAGL